MKNFVKHLSAIFTAAVMTLSAAVGTVSAQDGQQEETADYTGWTVEDGNWYYLENGEPHTLHNYNIDGVLRCFDADGKYTERLSGTVLENGKNRHYKNGLPVTGWTETNDGKLYRLDGYAVTGEFPVDGEICQFNSKGIYKGSRAHEIAVTCAEKISTDTEKIKFTFENLDGKSHEFKIAKSFEYFKDGEWVSCKSGRISYVSLDKELSKKGEKLSFEADVREYSKNKFKEGFYRLPVICGEETYYAVFEAVSPIEVKPQKEEYIFENYGMNESAKPVDDIKLDFTVNSEKTELLSEDINVKIEKQTENGWENVETDGGPDIALTKNEKKMTLIPYIYPDDGYYRATVSMGKFSTSEYFFMRFMRKHKAEAWLDEYDLNDKNMTVIFTVQNRENEPIQVYTKPYILYKKNSDGAWEYADGIPTDIELDANAYTTLKGGRSTRINFKLSDHYDISKLEAGEYAVEIDGIGLAEFTLTDKPAEKNLPFKDIKAEDIKEIQIVESYMYCIETVNIKHGDSVPNITDETDENDWREITSDVKSTEYIELIADYLRQFELKGKKGFEVYVGGRFYMNVTLKDGTKTTVEFDSHNVATYNGTMYYCGEYAYNAIMDIHDKLVARNLPFDDMRSEDFNEIRFEEIDCNKVTYAVLNRNYFYFDDWILRFVNLELLDEFEDFNVPTGGSVLSVTITYKNGKSERIIFYGHDVVLMPDGKAYYCFEWQYDRIYAVFSELHHSVSYIEPDDTLEEDTT